jgi:hypothetical protein
VYSRWRQLAIHDEFGFLSDRSYKPNCCICRQPNPGCKKYFVLEQVSANDTGGPWTVVRGKKFRVRIKSEDRASEILRKDDTNRNGQVTHGLNGTLNPA